jgi:hypothetical protein
MAVTIRRKVPPLGPEGGRERIAEQEHHDQQQRQKRQGKEQVGQAHQRAIHPLEIACQHPDQRAKEKRDRHGHKPYGDGDLPPRHHPRQHVAAKLVGAQRAGPAWRLVARADHLGGIGVDGGRVFRPDQRPDKDEKNQEPKDHKAHKRAAMGLELRPDIRPLAARLFDGGGVSHSGSSGPGCRKGYRRSG